MTVVLGVVLTSVLFSCDRSQSSLVDNTPREGGYGNQIPFGGSSSGREGKFRESLILHLLFLKCLSLWKLHVLEWHVLNSHSHILGWHILLPLRDERRHKDLFSQHIC